MSGSGGTPDYGFVGRGSGGAGGDSDSSGGAGFDCHAYQTTTMLRSPKADVVDGLQPGDRLIVVASMGSLTAETGRGDTAGSIVVPEQDELVRCIEQGVAYVAEVRSVRGGACVVEVSAT